MSARLELLLDLRHPLAYLALPGALEFGRERELAIDIQPLAVPTLRPPSEPAPDDDRGIRHRRHRARAIAREIEVYAEARGLVLRDWYRDEDAGAAHCAWLWVREERPDALPGFLERLFAAYWSSGLDPSSVDAVCGLVDEEDADACRDWTRGAGPGAAEAHAEAMRARGLFQVPAYVLEADGEDEVFYGRQHLPMIGWILDGRAGRGPI